MMENRSYDHFLGELSRVLPIAGDNYTGFPLGYTNPKAGNFAGPIPVVKASTLSFTDTLITPISPEHGYDGVLKQISDGATTDLLSPKMGAMQGFTINIIDRFNENEGNRFESPQLVMSYYERAQLPMYYFLAENYKVLDHWFAAHPGPTWPNRIATVTGSLIGLRNFDMFKDDRIGYLNETTIFDTLTQCGIDWKYVESNVGILRLFNNFRTDIRNVVPLRESDEYTLMENRLGDDPMSGLQLILNQNTLPRVLFIDPRFSDAPPIQKACDDLPPTNIKHGQQFIKDVYDRLSKSQHWKDMALVITYDEHGGFFDHVAPPGTPHSNLTGIEKIHPDGPSFLGVRVPTFLISPYVSDHSVSHTVFDHTSIFKTILVHNRHKIPSNIFAAASARVKKTEHFGVVFDLDSPKNAAASPDELYENDPLRPVPSDNETVYRTGQPVDVSDFHEVLRTLFVPEEMA